MLKQNAMKANFELPSGENKYMDFFELSKTCEHGGKTTADDVVAAVGELVHKYIL